MAAHLNASDPLELDPRTSRLARARANGAARSRRLRRGAVAAAAAALAGLAAGGCEPGKPAPPNILLVVVDTLRADHMSLYGYERETTPRLDEFAKRALVFENARASSSWTKPSTASLLTGLSAARHGVEGGDSRLPEPATTLAEVLWLAGYRTALISDNPFVSRTFGFAQGYEHTFDYSERPRPVGRAARYVEVEGEQIRSDDRFDWAQRSGAKVINGELLSWLASLGEADRWFAHVQYMDVHSPYAPPPAFRDRFRWAPAGSPALGDVWALEEGLAPVLAGTVVGAAVRQDLLDIYDGSIAYWDAQFGDLLERLEERGSLHNTIIAIVSDHGEAFYDHDTWDHGNSLYEELVRVPLLLRGPGIDAARDVRNVESTPLAATLLQFAGLNAAEIGGGTTLFDSAAENWRAQLDYKGRIFHATIEDGYKWVFSEQDGERISEVFDLEADPNELDDRSGELLERAATVRARLVERARAEREGGLVLEHSEIAEPVKEALRALGYVD